MAGTAGPGGRFLSLGGRPVRVVRGRLSVCQAGHLSVRPGLGSQSLGLGPGQVVKVLHHRGKVPDKKSAQCALGKEQDEMAGDTGSKFACGRDYSHDIVPCRRKTVGEEEQGNQTIKQEHRTESANKEEQKVRGLYLRNSWLRLFF